VSDQEFEQAVIEEPAYRTNDLGFSRMLLIELDRRFQIHGQLPDYATVPTIEHVMPQTLDDSWRHYLGEDAHSDQLENIIDTIGNLCLLSRPANSAVGQDPFASKRADYSPVTALARQIKEYTGHWNIATVRERSAMLAKKAVEIWPWAKV
jgi:hypothetical protein